MTLRDIAHLAGGFVSWGWSNGEQDGNSARGHGRAGGRDRLLRAKSGEQDRHIPRRSGSATDAVIVGEGETALMVAANAEAKVVNCATEAILAQNSCNGLRILVVDAVKMPFIARNTKLAWESGLPAVLTMDRAKQRANRLQACGRFKPNYGGQCDEYPMASTAEGGAGARTEEVPGRENHCQGGSIVRQFPSDGERFLVVISRPDLIASDSFTGADIAASKDCR